MSEFRYTCPSCAAVLKTANAIPAGKAIKCPKCQTVFKPAAEGVAPAAAPRPAAPAAPPPRPAAPAARPSGQTPAAKPPAPRAPAPPPAAVKAAKPTEAPPPADGSVQIHDHKGTVTLPKDWKKKRPKSGSNSMVLLGCLGGGLLIILVCCGGPIMLAALAPDPEPGPPRNGGPRVTPGPINGGVRVTQGELIGVWAGKTLANADVSYEFKPNGQVQFNQAAMKKTGRFTIQGDDMIQITWTTPPRQLPSTLRVTEFGPTEMTIQDDDGLPLTLTRKE